MANCKVYRTVIKKGFSHNIAYFAEIYAVVHEITKLVLAPLSKGDVFHMVIS